jgi:hypothetical protein
MIFNPEGVVMTVWALAAVTKDTEAAAAAPAAVVSVAETRTSRRDSRMRRFLCVSGRI